MMHEAVNQRVVRQVRNGRPFLHGWIRNGYVLSIIFPYVASAGTPWRGGARSGISDSVVAVTTDTGPLAPGDRDFSRFTVPGLCVAAAHHATDVARRALAVRYAIRSLRDTAPEHDTLPAQVVTLARTCGARFTLPKTAPADLPALFTLALLQGNDTLARAVVHRRLALAPSAAERQAVFAEGVASYLAASPARVTDAERLAAEADTAARAQRANSMRVHLPLLATAVRAFDRPRMLHEATRLIALGHTLDFRVIQDDYSPIVAAWRAVLQVAFYDHPDSVLALAQQAKADLSRFPRTPGDLKGFNFITATVAAVRNTLAPFDVSRDTSIRVRAPVVAKAWFPSPPEHWPPKGTVSLVLYGGSACAHRLDLNNACDEVYHPWRALVEQYATRGLTLTIVEQTIGTAARSIFLSPAAEADTLNWYYRTYLHIPATLAIAPTALVRQVALPDGRRWYTDTTALGRSIGIHTEGLDIETIAAGLALLYDRDGTVLYAGPQENFTLLRALIIRALTSSSASSAQSHP